MARPTLHLSPHHSPGSCLSLPCFDKSELPDSYHEPPGFCGVNNMGESGVRTSFQTKQGLLLTKVESALLLLPQIYLDTKPP